jgi:hypothetical protein
LHRLALPAARLGGRGGGVVVEPVEFPECALLWLVGGGVLLWLDRLTARRDDGGECGDVGLRADLGLTLGLTLLVT